LPLKRTRADKIAPKKIEWLWGDRIPRGMITIVGGKPDQGKGLFCTHVAAQVSNLRLRSPRTGKPRMGRVLYSAWEDLDDAMTRPRLEAAGANLKNVELVRFQVPSQLEELALTLAQEEFDLMVMDPLAAHLDSGISRFSDNIRRFTNPMKEILAVTGTAMIIVEHQKKNMGKHADPITAIGGSSSGIVAAARMAFLFGEDPGDEDRRILANLKHNIRDRPMEQAFEMDTVYMDSMEQDVPFLVGGMEVDFPIEKLLWRSKQDRMGRPADKRAQAAEWLTKYLYNNDPGTGIVAHRIYEDAKQWGMNSKTLGAAAKEMGIVKDPPGGGRSCKWSLPDELQDLARATFEAEAAEETGLAPKGVEPPEDTVVITDEDIAKLLNPDGDAQGGDDGQGQA